MKLIIFILLSYIILGAICVLQVFNSKEVKIVSDYKIAIALPQVFPNILDDQPEIMEYAWRDEEEIKDVPMSVLTASVEPELPVE